MVGKAGMRIEFEETGDVCVVRLEGRFVTGSDAEYQRTRDRLNSSPYNKVIVDCGEVPYLDSTALNFLVGLYTSTTNRGGRLALCGLNERMSEVMRITRLDRVIPLYRDRAAALAALARPAASKRRAEEA
jgi:anti-anti-sigma factor